jgi:hypothetical protein
MTSIYRGVKIDSSRSQALGGWSEVYWNAYRESDGYEIVCNFGGGSVREMFKVLKETVDEFLDVFEGNEDKWENRNDYYHYTMNNIMFGWDDTDKIYREL